jgi:hypothetical protein
MSNLQLMMLKPCQTANKSSLEIDRWVQREAAALQLTLEPVAISPYILNKTTGRVIYDLDGFKIEYETKTLSFLGLRCYRRPFCRRMCGKGLRAAAGADDCSSPAFWPASRAAAS